MADCAGILFPVLARLALLVVGLLIAAPTAQAGDLDALRGKTIAVDPGHNGKDWAYPEKISKLVDAGTLWKPCDSGGTATRSGYMEATFNWDVSLRLRRILERAGAHVVLTRKSNDGWGPCITTRAAIGNRARADAAISIHADGSTPSGRGFHVIYPPSLAGLTDDIAEESYRLALAVRAAYGRATGMPYSTYTGREGLNARSDLGGLNLSDVPKVFIETGNMRNATDAALLETASFRQRAARGIAAGLAAFLARG